MFSIPAEAFRWGHKFNMIGVRFVVGKHSMIVSDGDDHHRRRSSVQTAFTRRRLNSWIPFTTRSRVRADGGAIAAIIDTEISQRRSHPTGNPFDIFEAIVNEGSLSDAEIRDQVKTLIGAGYDTTASALARILWCAALSLDAWTRLRAEADAVLGPIDATSADSDQSTLAGRDPGSWTDPLHFDPDRFADLTPEQKTASDQAWVPFGRGPPHVHRVRPRSNGAHPDHRPPRPTTRPHPDHHRDTTPDRHGRQPSNRRRTIPGLSPQPHLKRHDRGLPARDAQTIAWMSPTSATSPASAMDNQIACIANLTLAGTTRGNARRNAIDATSKHARTARLRVNA